MLLAEDFPRTARKALRGKWRLAVGTGFVATLFMEGYLNSEYDKVLRRVDIVTLIVI